MNFLKLYLAITTTNGAISLGFVGSQKDTIVEFNNRIYNSRVQKTILASLAGAIIFPFLPFKNPLDSKELFNMYCNYPFHLEIYKFKISKEV